MSYHSNFIKKALGLRKRGYSYSEISQRLKTSKSSVYLWCRDVVLDKTAQERIKNRLIFGIIKAKKELKRKKDWRENEIKEDVDLYLKNLNSVGNLNKLLCSFLYWAEGEKTTRCVVFINSSPIMISTFLTLLRSSFKLDEKKFRCLVHIHEYHNNDEIKRYWSDITKIPINQFSKSYIKPNTKKRIRNEYKGTVSIRYYDYKIALELNFIYNRFAKSILAH